MPLEQQALVAQGCRNLLARILQQALKDETLQGFPRRDWPWSDLHPRIELDSFWRSEWFHEICEWLDIQPDNVLQLAEEARRNGRDATRAV